MSGILALLNLDRAPIDSALLQKLTDTLAFRGPDAQSCWSEGAIGLAHTLLQTVSDTTGANQPLSLDGQLWISADVRLDRRAELIDRLEQTGSRLKLDPFTPDAALILYAYHTWGQDCLAHLWGDFSFTLWDSRQQVLFCARDQLGIKPFYYAQVGQTLICTNTLQSLRGHPLVSDQLNERAIADFLIFTINYDPATTSFADIQRLPPAHCLTLSLADPTVKVHRYWSLPCPEPIRYRCDQDYIYQLKTLLKLAVGDRLRTERVSLLLSGGMDSSSLAATATQGFPSTNLKAFTTVYDRLIPDQERYYASQVAQFLSLPIEFLIADDFKLYQDWSSHAPPQPHHNPRSIVSHQLYQLASHHSHVALYGEGGDEGFTVAFLLDLLHGMPWSPHLFTDLWRCWRYRARPGLGFQYYRNRYQNRLSLSSPTQQSPPFPAWLRSDLIQRLDLVDRWHQIHTIPKPEVYPFRPRAYNRLTFPLWGSVLENINPGFTGLPLEIRLPFLDLRLVEFLLALPPWPWCIHKKLLRLGMQDMLPPIITQRPKTALVADPIPLMQPALNLTEVISTASGLDRYVDLNELQTHLDDRNQSSARTWQTLRPVSLGLWFLDNFS
uniref:asparagine synthase (glutamine-hydrolyzing) n=1 Tax=Cyanothece sp. (strain PCC 7425 / ATCC 29141) TaxID=395961 RepID=B8HL60_CYAP4